MKEIIVIAVFLCFGMLCVAQQHDNNMVFGLHFGTIPPDNEEGTLLNFSDYPPTSKVMNQSLLNINSCGFSMSDECGEMIFYSNGLSIVDSTNNIMSNGTNLNAGGFGVDINLGYFDPLGMTCVPSPEGNNSYYLFHRVADTGDSIVLLSPEILFTKIDMSGNEGQGVVIEKNITAIEGLRLVNLSNVKHGNGKDWWLISAENYDNRYYVVLLNEQGFSTQAVQQIGFKYPYIKP